MSQVIEGNDILLYRRIALKRAMEALHLHGAFLGKRSQNPFSIVKREEGFTGGRERVYLAYCTKYGLAPRPEMVADA